MSDWIVIAKPRDFNQLKKFLSVNYNPAIVASVLQAGIASAVKGIFIEYNYIDKDYRSTFYNFYAKKGKYYSDKCIRLHFFNGNIGFDLRKFDFNVDRETLQDGYLGFSVLRPTGNATFGRTVISPKARRNAKGWMVTSVHKVHVVGHTLEIRGFPWMNQHADISACAHAVCWAILRHYSERYSKYAEFLTHDITVLAKESDPGGLAPASGLFSGEAEKVFYRSGTYPALVEKYGEGLADESFYRQLGCYLDSGFPIFACMDEILHAIAVIGFNLKDEFPYNTQTQYAWENVSSLIGVDDNFLPYAVIENTDSPSHPDGQNYTVANINEFIVPLPEKIYYPASAVDIVAINLPDSCPVNFPPQNDCVIRYFVTTSAAYKRFVREHVAEFDPVLAKGIFTLPMAQFIWIIEYATVAQWEISEISTRVVLDATASAADNDMFWMFFDDNKAFLFDRSVLNVPPVSLTLKPTGYPYTRMQSNLHVF